MADIFLLRRGARHLDYGGDALREAADLELRQLEENLAKLRAEAETD